MTLSPRNSEADAGPRLLRDIWALTAVASVILILRIIAKLRIGKFAVDDLLMTFALFSALVGSTLLTIAIKNGFGRRVVDINRPKVPEIIMYDYLAQTFGLAGGTLGRMSFIIFIAGLLVQRWSQKVALWVLALLQVIVNTVFVIIIFAQCPSHTSAIWDNSGKNKCWDLRVQTYYGYFQGAFNSATDLYLAVFSTYIFWNLNLKLRVKLGLVTLLGMGIFAMAAAIVKTVETHVLGTSSDPTTATVNYDCWLYIETYLVIITASIPCIRSLLRSMKSRKLNSGHTHELSSRYVVGSGHKARARRRESSLDGKRIINVSEGNVTQDNIERGDGQYEAPESRQSRESVV
ncbi:hypothetical protein N7532_011311, partial [Penicillium argentinense]